MDDGFGACPGGQGELVWGAGLVDWLCKVLGDAARHNSAEDVPDDDAPDAAVRFS